jgi:hypothetical protein
MKTSLEDFYHNSIEEEYKNHLLLSKLSFAKILTDNGCMVQMGFIPKLLSTLREIAQ